MGDVADRPSVPADQVLGPGSVELLVDPLLFRCLTQLPVLRDGHHYRYHRAPMMDNVVGVTGGQFAHEGHGNDMDRRRARFAPAWMPTNCCVASAISVSARTATPATTHVSWSDSSSQDCASTRESQSRVPHVAGVPASAW